MKLKTLLLKISLLFAATIPLAVAGQLPGRLVTPSSFDDMTIDGRAVRVYQQFTFFTTPIFFTSAALIANPGIGSVPACNYSSTNRAFVNAYGRVSHEIYSRRGAVLFKSCTKESSQWPDGQQLLVNGYFGANQVPAGGTFSSFILLPRNGSTISEWTLF